MKTFTSAISAIVLIFSLGFISCSKMGEGGHKNENKSVTLNVTLNQGELYNLDLSPYGDEDDLASITTQANEYAVSTISRGSSFYNYQFQSAGTTKVSIAAAETVVIKVSEPEGRCHRTDQTTVTLHFTLK